MVVESKLSSLFEARHKVVLEMDDLLKQYRALQVAASNLAAEIGKAKAAGVRS